MRIRRRSVVEPDLLRSDRWPVFAPAALAPGIDAAFATCIDNLDVAGAGIQLADGNGRHTSWRTSGPVMARLEAIEDTFNGVPAPTP